jgi:hypothetical protein
VTVRMWEAVVVPGRLQEAQDWLRSVAALGSQAYTDGAGRIVLIGAGQVDHPPEGLLERAHAWDFHPLS